MEPVAIVGIGCRLPGQCSSPSKLWNLLKTGKSAYSRVPANRFNVDSWYHPDTQKRGFVHSDGGYFLSHDESHLLFDPSFFGISPIEAQLIDPQQRKLLEVVYETFESAGKTLDKVSGSQTACYIGCFTSDYRTMQQRTVEDIAPYTMTGSDMTIISNRINYVFNLKGPSFTVDTACSSSLYALHLACQSLLSGDCEAAIVGGTNLILGIEQHLGSVSLGVLSPTSKCHTFDEKADGFGRADGITAIYIKTLSAAMANGDPIRGIIRSTAINTNGKSSGINHPEVAGQEAVMRKAYARACLQYDDTGFFECHGTGTPVGDPIEVAAVGRVFAEGRTAKNPLLLGSIKTNLGHTEGASGIASVIKCVLSLENAMVPANAEFERLNPRIDLRNGRLSIVQRTVPWPSYQTYRRASINSFGYGGANAHVIIDAASCYFERLGHKLDQSMRCSLDTRLPPTSKHLLVFSAHNMETLDKTSSHILRNLSGYRLLDVAYTLSAHRSRMQQSCFAITDSSDGSQEAIKTRTVSGGKVPVVAFVFTGQGAQWPRMGYELVSRFGIVQKTLDYLQLVLDKLPCPPTWKILDELSKPAESSKVYDAELSQPLGTAIQIALVDLFQSWNIVPAAVTAHSSGEVAAAYAAGAITAAEAITIAYCRGIAVVKRSLPGAMLAVGLGASEVAQYLLGHAGVVIGCHNSPQSVTLSGEEASIDQLATVFNADKVFARKVNSSGNGYHSPLVNDAARYLAEEFGALLPQRSTTESRVTTPMYSCVTADLLLAKDVGLNHWLGNLTGSVLFNQSLQALVSMERRVDMLIEIGPHAALSGPIRQVLSFMGQRGQEIGYHASLVRGQDSVENLLALAGHLFVRGYSINVENVNSLVHHDNTSPDGHKYEKGKLLVDLPTYQWSYGKLSWVESRLSRAIRFRKYPSHDLLGSLEMTSSLKSPTPSWHNYLRIKDVPWIADHKIGHDVLFPAAAYTAMAIEALRQISEERGQIIHEVNISRLSILAPLLMPPEGHVETMVNLQTFPAAGSSSFSFVISSISSEGRCIEHVRGFASYGSAPHNTVKEHSHMNGIRDRTKTRKERKQNTTDKRWYETLAQLGLHYGPAFQPLLNIRNTTKNNGAIAEALMCQSDTESRYLVHPTLLDGCLQLSFISTMFSGHLDHNKAYLPVEFTSLRIYHSHETSSGPVTIHASATIKGLRDAIGSFKIFNSDLSILAEAEVAFKSTEGSFGTAQENSIIEPYSRLVWQKLDGEGVVGITEQLSKNENYLSTVLTYYLVYFANLHPLLKASQDALQRAGYSVSALSFADISKSLPRNADVIVFAEIEKPLLGRSTPSEFEAVQWIFRNASSIIWVTRSGILSGGAPHSFLMMGIAKTIRTEQPALKLCTIDFDPSADDCISSADILVSQVVKLRNFSDTSVDNDLAVKNNTVHVSRFIKDSEENSNHQMSQSVTIVHENLEDSCSLRFQRVGDIGTFYYGKSAEGRKLLGSDEVSITARIWPLSKSDTMVLKGRQASDSSIYECVGVASDIGSCITSLDVGDGVFSISDEQFDTSFTCKEALCVRLQPGDLKSPKILGSIVPYCIATNALMTLSRAIKGETLLLLNLNSDVTEACSRIGDALGLKILVASAYDRSGHPLPNNRIFGATSITQIDLSHLEQQLGEVMSGDGLDIVIAASVDTKLQQAWNHLAQNGRLIFTGTGRNADFTGWDFASAFSKGATMTSFNLAEMVKNQPQKLGSLLNQAIQLLRQEDSKCNKETIEFDISRLPEAVDCVTATSATNRVLVTFSPESIVPTLHIPSCLKFPSTASYMLVGCLGGLGRSLTMWMAERGARNFVFLSRSGADKPFAASMLEELQAFLARDTASWSAQVIRGDVACLEDVAKAISIAPTPIKGVIQASMVLESHVFTQMPHASWSAVLTPKVCGTENLHNALQHEDLDFFVMTSSAIGILGIPTQGAYAAANAFLDAMARYRWARGLQACSLALGMVSGVGHVAEHSDIQHRLQRYGSYPIPEREFLSALETACTRKPLPQGPFPSPSSSSSSSSREAAQWGPDILAGAHLMTGLDLSRASKHLVPGSPAANWLKDPRMSILLAEFEARNATSHTNTNYNNHDNESTSTSPPLQTVLQTHTTHGAHAAKQLLLQHIISKFSKLTGIDAANFELELDRKGEVDVENVNVNVNGNKTRNRKAAGGSGLDKPLAEWGVDSLVGAELKRWCWGVWGVEVEVLGLVEEGEGVGGLWERVWAGLNLGKGEGSGLGVGEGEGGE